MTKLRIVPIAYEELGEIVAFLPPVFHHTYRDILSPEQIDYMVEKFYSLEAFQEAYHSGHMQYLAVRDGAGQVTGYAACKPKAPQGVYVMHLYLHPQTQGQGTGRQVIEHIAQTYAERPITLRVNRYNIAAINFYFRVGFTIQKVVDIPIDGGFTMNDYVMMRPPLRP